MDTPRTPRTPRRTPIARSLVRVLAIAGGCALLTLAFAGYLQPSFIVDLANRILLCM
jgi:hypothetical protein